MLAARWFRVSSATVPPRGGAYAEGAVEGPRRIVFDLGNVTEYDKAAPPKRECCNVRLAPIAQWETFAPGYDPIV